MPQAVEGKDYTLDRLLPIWDLTNRQDWTICEDQQAGVSSRAYVPGPFSLVRERNVAHFLDWYLGELAREPAEPGPHRRDRRRRGGLLDRLSPGQARPDATCWCWRRAG